MACITVLKAVFLATFTASLFGFSRETCSVAHGKEWCYEGKKGPEGWWKIFKNCSGKYQSPINVKTSELTAGSGVPLLYVYNYDQEVTKATVKNNGYSLEVEIKDDESRYVSVLDVVYELTQFHFHWDQDGKHGSEHAIDKKYFAAEINLVHKRRDMDEQPQFCNELQCMYCVVARPMKMSRDDNPALKPILDKCEEVKHRGDRTDLGSTLNLDKLLPLNGSEIACYNGSRTTPICDQDVMWHVILDPMPVSKHQLEQFRTICSTPKPKNGKDNDKNCRITHNNRPVQPLNGRKVYRSQLIKRSDSTDSDGSDN